MIGEASTRKAAFFRLEGTLSPRPTLTAAAWLAANAQAVGERLARLTNVALAAPFVLRGDRTRGGRVAWMGLCGISEDRLIVLGEEYAERWIIPSLAKVGLELLETARTRGHRIVLISDNLEAIARPVAEYLEIADLVCNRIEIRSGKVTGRLMDPVIGGSVALQWARRFASEESIDLSTSLAYGAHGDDTLLLSGIGRPCAVSPDRTLRRTAREMEWPVVEGRGGRA